MGTPRYPSLYQINTRVWLTALAQSLGRPATLDDIPDAELDRLAGDGLRLDLVPERLADGPGGTARLAHQPGVAARIPGHAAGPPRGRHRGVRLRHHRLRRPRAARRRRGARAPARAAPRARPAAAARFRPESHGHRSPVGARRIPSTTSRAPTTTSRARRRTTRGSTARTASRVFAYGRDPYFAGWPDTLQLNYANPATQEAMIATLVKIAGQCDGVRCDMAMLVLPDVFERTWGLARGALLAASHRARARAGARLLLHGRGLLGPRMDAAAAGIRLHLRQAAVRPASRRARPADPRALPRRTRLPEQDGPLPGKPRRAARGRDVLARRARGGGRHHVPVARPALLSSGAVRRMQEADLSAPRSRSGRAVGSSACSSSTTGSSRR